MSDSTDIQIVTYDKEISKNLTITHSYLMNTLQEQLKVPTKSSYSPIIIVYFFNGINLKTIKCE